MMRWGFLAGGARRAAAPPSRPLLLAEVDAELRVALSLSDGRGIADPLSDCGDSSRCWGPTVWTAAP